MIIKKGTSEKSDKENKELLEKAVTYTSFADLNDFNDDHLLRTNADKFLKQDLPDRMKDPEQWHMQFECIDELRMLNRFHIVSLMVEISKYFKFIKDSIENLRSGISKNALLFMTEFFNNEEVMTNADYKETITEFVNTTMATIVFKTIYEKAFIANLAK